MVEEPTMHISPCHSQLGTLLRQVCSAHQVDAPDRTGSGASALEEMTLCDFGVQFKLVSKRSKKEKQLLVYMLVPGFRNNLQVPVERSLRELYGEAVVFGTDKLYDVVIDVYEAMRVPGRSLGSLLQGLSQLRIQTVGAPISMALRMVSSALTSRKETVQAIVTHPRLGTCYCVESHEKAMVIFVVTVEDPTERAIARLFLQQFEVAQKRLPQSPHCEFRWPNQPPAELGHLAETEHFAKADFSVGFQSFAFFPFHVKTPEARQRATQLLVNFLPYLDKHIKSTTSYMRGRMRSEQQNLLRSMKTGKDMPEGTPKSAKVRVGLKCTSGKSPMPPVPTRNVGVALRT